MLRAIAILAVVCTGLALGVYAAAIIRAHLDRPVAPQALFETPELDPVAAAAEIAEIHAARGSVLDGTSFASYESPDTFNTALANQTGVELPDEAQQEREDLVGRLRRSAHSYDDQAARFEDRERYVEADELRRLGDETRRVARLLAKEQR
jgi:hypothetical protein